MKTRSDRLRRWQWVDPIYDMSVFLLRGPGEPARRWINRRITDEDYQGTFAQGKMVFYSGPRGTALIIWLPSNWTPKTSACLATLAHECVHGAVAVLQHRGLKLSDESEEAFSYYVGWLFRGCHERLTR